MTSNEFMKNVLMFTIIPVKDFKGPIYYLENEYVKIDNKVVFGGTMYSDFNLYKNPTLYSKYAETGMNDFRYVMTEEKNSFRVITPQDYINKFNIFIDKLKETLQETTEDVIVVTHFAPSEKSISEKYNGKWKSLNPAYASNLIDFIKSNPRIKLWVHGHMHDNFNYKIGKCKVVCHPYGYKWDRTDEPTQYNGKIVTIR